MAAQPPKPTRPEYDELERELLRLPDLPRRAALALLGLALGDAVGLPFELSIHRRNRENADRVAAQAESVQALEALVLELIVERVGRGGPTNAFARTFSDDTVVADCKMSALAQLRELLGRRGFGAQPVVDLLWHCLLSQLLSWANGTHGGNLFQGFGGFTRGLLRPKEAGRSRSPKPDFDNREGVPGCDTWPEVWFADHAEAYCAGQRGSLKSYGNGAVMSFAPQAVAAELLGSSTVSFTDTREIISALPRLSDTHRHQDAMRGADLLGEVVGAVLRGEVVDSAGLPNAVLRSRTWQEMLESNLTSHPAYPLRAFDAFLRQGDCSEEEVCKFIVSFARVQVPPLASEPFGVYALGNQRGLQMGRLLRTAANWDDEYQERGRHITLIDGEEIRFSQRGLNSVLIALWCCIGAQRPWDWLARLIYVGGDSDTVGAVCGQIAGAMMEPGDVCRAFRRFVAIGDCETMRPCANIASAAALRYFHRVLRFCGSHWDDLANTPRLTDPLYPPLTEEQRGLGISAAEGCYPFVRVLWADRALAASSSSDIRSSRRGSREVEAALGRRRMAEAADRRGSLQIICATTVDSAATKLTTARRGADLFDVVVSEFSLDRNEAGLEILTLIDSLWHGSEESRPMFFLLTTWYDERVVKSVRGRPRAACLRFDRPEAIVQAIVGARCRAATLPPELRLPVAERGGSGGALVGASAGRATGSSGGTSAAGASSGPGTSTSGPDLGNSAAAAGSTGGRTVLDRGGGAGCQHSRDECSNFRDSGLDPIGGAAAASSACPSLPPNGGCSVISAPHGPPHTSSGPGYADVSASVGSTMPLSGSQSSSEIINL